MAYALTSRTLKAETKETSTMTMIVTQSGSGSKRKIRDPMTHFTTKLVNILDLCYLRFNYTNKLLAKQVVT